MLASLYVLMSPGPWAQLCTWALGATQGPCLGDGVLLPGWPLWEQHPGPPEMQPPKTLPTCGTEACPLLVTALRFTCEVFVQIKSLIFPVPIQSLAVHSVWSRAVSHCLGVTQGICLIPHSVL